VVKFNFEGLKELIDREAFPLWRLSDQTGDLSNKRFLAHRSPMQREDEHSCSILALWPPPHTLSTTLNPRDANGRLSRLMAAS
jgi:hypothetical protein